MQREKILIRRHILQCLIWVCTVCLCQTKRTLGKYGLVSTTEVIVYIVLHVSLVMYVSCNMSASFKMVLKLFSFLYKEMEAILFNDKVTGLNFFLEK